MARMASMASMIHMTLERIAVFLPCYSLDDFPTWLEESQADDLLAAWTAAWHPQLIASFDRMPMWLSAEVPPADGAPIVGIVPSVTEDRLAGMLSANCMAGSRWVRQVSGRPAIVAASLAAVRDGTHGVDAEAVCEPVLTDDFFALGLAWLLCELLARRMRSSTGLGSTSFEESVVAAARAAVAGNEAIARERLQECFDVLLATRHQYYPVDAWLMDIVLLAESTLGRRLAGELDSPVPLTLVATGRVVEILARDDSALLERLRQRVVAGTLSPAGGRYESTPLDACTPETLWESFAHGHRVWRECVGSVPTTYAQCTGGSSAMVPQVLASFGYAGAIWNLFDGTPLPDPGTSRIRWEGSGDAAIDAVARAPLDARLATTVLQFADKLGDAMDHDHAAIVQCAHHAGTANPWFDCLRRIGRWSTVLGTFVTADELFRRTAGTGTLATFEPDAFPSTLPPFVPGFLPVGADGGGAGIVDPVSTDPIGMSVAAEEAQSRVVLEASRALDRVRPLDTLEAGVHEGIRRSDAVVPQAHSEGVPQTDRKKTSGWPAIVRRIVGAGSGSSSEQFVLENKAVRVRVNPATGGVLSLRRPGDRGNQLSQQLSLRTTLAAPPAGSHWEDPQERADYSGMVADRIERVRGGIHSLGRLVDSQGRDVGTFTQRLFLVNDMPLARLDMSVKLLKPLFGPVFEEHVTCRFAWNENDSLDFCRSLHAQSIVTERTRFTAPHFVELRDASSTALPSESSAGASRAAPERIAIFTGGLPWHIRSSPHMLDSILLAGSRTEGAFTMAMGLGIDRPWDVAMALHAAGPEGIAGSIGSLKHTGPSNVRITGGVPVYADSTCQRMIGMRVGLLESVGRSGDVRIEWGAEVESAWACDALGRPLAGDGGPTFAVDGRSTTVWLRRYGWLQMELRFRVPVSQAVPPAA